MSRFAHLYIIKYWICLGFWLLSKFKKNIYIFFLGTSEEPTPGKYTDQYHITMSTIILIQLHPIHLPLLPLTNISYVLAEPRPRRYKCGLSAPCPPKHLAFRLVSGAANVIGPKICLEDKMWDSVLTVSFLFSDVFVSPAVSIRLFFLFVSHSVLFSSLCCHNQTSKSVWGAECKYSFSLSAPHFFDFVFNLFYICGCFSSTRQHV